MTVSVWGVRPHWHSRVTLQMCLLWGQYYYYEVIVTIQKVLISIIGLALFETAEASQMVFVVFVNIFAATLSFKFMPYADDNEDFKDSSSQWAVFLLSFFSLIIRANNTDNEGYNMVTVGVFLALAQVCVRACVQVCMCVCV